MRFAFIDVEKASYPLRILCRVLAVSRSGYYAWRARKPSARDLEDERLRPKVVEAFETGRGTYGSPRVRDEWVDQGFEIGRKRVARLMREMGLQRVSPRRFRVTTDSNHDHPIAENVLDRLGVAGRFCGIFAITDADFVPKPEAAPYAAMVERFRIEPGCAVMVEDIARNLEPAAALGMTTVWVRTDSVWGAEGSEGDHVHHIIDDVADWLAGLTG